jgi:hypothetical protein
MWWPTRGHESSPSPLALVPEPVGTAPLAAARTLIYVPLPNDVILGRGVPINKYEGNVRFRDLIRMHKDAYMATGRQHIKQEIFLQVMHELKERNFRFIIHVETTDAYVEQEGMPPNVQASWCEASAEAAESKVKQALRERDHSETTKDATLKQDSSQRSPRKRSHGKACKSAPQRANLVAHGSLPLTIAGWTGTTPISTVATLPPSLVRATAQAVPVTSALAKQPALSCAVTRDIGPATGLDVLEQAAAMRLVPARLASAREFRPPAVAQIPPVVAAQLAPPPLSLPPFLSTPRDLASTIELRALRQAVAQGAVPTMAVHQLARPPLTLPPFLSNPESFGSTTTTAPFAPLAMLDPSWLSLSQTPPFPGAMTLAPFQQNPFSRLPQVLPGHGMPLGIRGPDIPVATLEAVHATVFVETLEHQRQRALRQVDEYYIRHWQLYLLQQQQQQQR